MTCLRLKKTLIFYLLTRRAKLLIFVANQAEVVIISRP